MAARFAVGITGTKIWTNADTSIWAATSGGASGASVPGVGDTVTLDANSGSGTLVPNYDFIVTSITMGAFGGTLDFSVNNNSPTMATFSCTGTGVRTLIQGNGLWTITGNAATVFSYVNMTNFTFVKGSQPFTFTYSGSTGTRTIQSPSRAAFGALDAHPDFSVTAGSDILAINASRYGNLNLTGFTGSLGTSAQGAYGNVTLGTGMTITSTPNGYSFFGASGTQVLTTNGVVFARPMSIGNAAGCNLQLADNLTTENSTNGTIVLNNGTFDTNSKTVIATSFSSSNSNARSLVLGSSSITLRGTGTVFNIANSTNMTVSAGTSTITINDASSSSKTFEGGEETFYNLVLSGAGTGTFIIGTTTATTRFNNITVSTPPHTVQIRAGKTLVANTITWSGTAGNINVFESTVAGTPWYINVPNGTVTQDYISLQDSYAVGGATFNPGANSVDAGGNRGWVGFDAVVLGRTIADKLLRPSPARDQSRLNRKV